MIWMIHESVTKCWKLSKYDWWIVHVPIWLTCWYFAILSDVRTHGNSLRGFSCSHLITNAWLGSIWMIVCHGYPLCLWRPKLDQAISGLSPVCKIFWGIYGSWCMINLRVCLYLTVHAAFVFWSRNSDHGIQNTSCIYIYMCPPCLHCLRSRTIFQYQYAFYKMKE